MQTLRLIATEKKVRLLEHLLSGEEEKIRVRAAAQAAGVSAGYVSLLVKRMEQDGLVEHGKLSSEDPRVHALRMLFNADRLARAWPKLRKAGVMGFGVFGSWARGTNGRNSDLDVWIKVRKDLGAADASRMRTLLKGETGVSEASLIILTPQRSGEIKNKDPLFYSTLLNSFIIGGEQVD
jgi:predicted nucleotidyltransferase